jgi:hypothetical protein
MIRPTRRPSIRARSLRSAASGAAPAPSASVWVSLNADRLDQFGLRNLMRHGSFGGTMRESTALAVAEGIALGRKEDIAMAIEALARLAAAYPQIAALPGGCC